MAFAEDLTPFFSIAEFAVSATLGGVAVSVLFNNGYSAGSVGSLGMGDLSPSITLPTAQVPASPIGLFVAVGGGSYVVAEHQPNATGISTLLLERAP
jgi:hypothetical protein